MRPYSLDLRVWIAAAVDHHDGSIRGIARVFRVSTSFIVHLLQRRRAAGTLAPEPHRGGRPPALGTGDLERLAGLVREQTDATLEQRYGKRRRIWVIGRGMINRANLKWLKERGCRYIVMTHKI
jgi:transposase